MKLVVFALACIAAIGWLGVLALAATRARAWVLARPFAQAALGIVTAAWLIGVYATFIEPARLVVRRVEIESAVWTGPPLRIGIVSDTHVGAPPHLAPESTI